MARLILSKAGVVLREIPVGQERVTIGRRPHNHIVIEDLAISGEHAAIVAMNEDAFLEDLNSTNGTQVNGQPVRKHFLQDGDVIELAQYRLTYLAAPGDCSGKTSEVDAGLPSSATGRIRVLNGPKAGKEIVLTKTMTTLGRPGVQVAVLMCSGEGYLLAHVEGQEPLVNGLPISAPSHPIRNGDVIDLSGTRLQVDLA